MTKYRVAKTRPMSYIEEKDYGFGCDYIEFDNKEQFENMSMTSNAYKMLVSRYMYDTVKRKRYKGGVK